MRKSRRRRSRPRSAATWAPGAPREDRGEAEVVDVLVSDDQQVDVLDRVPARGERLFELVERLGGVGP